MAKKSLANKSNFFAKEKKHYPIHIQNKKNHEKEMSSEVSRLLLKQRSISTFRIKKTKTKQFQNKDISGKRSHQVMRNKKSLSLKVIFFDESAVVPITKRIAVTIPFITVENSYGG